MHAKPYRLMIQVLKFNSLFKSKYLTFMFMRFLHLFNFKSLREQRVPKPETRKPESIQDLAGTKSGAEIFKNLFDSMFWNGVASSGEKKIRNDVEDLDDDDDEDVDTVDFMSCTNIPNVSRRSSWDARTFSSVAQVKEMPNVKTFQRERCKNDVKTDDESVKIWREKASLVKKILTDARPDPKTTFTALMDFDFFSQIRQPWRKCKDVQINYIV